MPVVAETRTISADSRNVPRVRLADLVLDQVQPRGVGEVALGQDHDAPGQFEKRENIQMLTRLRHHRIVGGDHQHRQVEARGPRKHVADEPLVAGDVDQGQADRAQIERRESEVDGHAPGLLLGQAVGVDAGQGADQGGLAVVDVTGRAQDQVALVARRHRRPLVSSAAFVVASGEDQRPLGGELRRGSARGCSRDREGRPEGRRQRPGTTAGSRRRGPTEGRRRSSRGPGRRRRRPRPARPRRGGRAGRRPSNPGPPRPAPTARARRSRRGRSPARTRPRPVRRGRRPPGPRTANRSTDRDSKGRSRDRRCGGRPGGGPRRPARRRSPRRRRRCPQPPARALRPSAARATAIEPVPAIRPTPQPSGVPAATTRSPSLTSTRRSAHCPAWDHSPRSRRSSGRSNPATPRHATATARGHSPAVTNAPAIACSSADLGRLGSHGLGVGGPRVATADHPAVGQTEQAVVVVPPPSTPNRRGVFGAS